MVFVDDLALYAVQAVLKEKRSRRSVALALSRPRGLRKRKTFQCCAMLSHVVRELRLVTSERLARQRYVVASATKRRLPTYDAIVAMSGVSGKTTIDHSHSVSPTNDRG